ncbi:hypothetical protein VST7929_00662 [Vibrio stylophorae]|uniref:Nucleoside permease n=1 Tax=Vibrio stylophorae TaxID=659351 RepID=A0ABM8ZR81_9VIBR|nr:NupC/NupG family nucleoside CNT transporter [Vibrio stylophorae]CAH0532815.1 hypothetical protein VST7929_00662 [Vibrio stylophorae]
MSLFMSLVGMVVLLLIAVLLSDNRKAINLRTVGGAFAIQASLGAFVLYVPWGKDVLNTISGGVQNVIDYGKDGIGFIFGSLVNFSVDGIGFIFAFQVLPTIIFFSSLIAVLYYLGIMQWVITILGGGLQKVLGTSRSESLSATANIFVGQTEAPLVVRPFVPKMTQSELFAVMCGGLASIAGGVLAGYAMMGVKLEYLIAASFMAAPGGLLFAKIIKPETDKPIEQLDGFGEQEEKPANVIDAAAAGASSGLQLALNVGAMLLAFIGLIALVNGLLGGLGHLVGYGDGDLKASFDALVAAATTPEAIAALEGAKSAMIEGTKIDISHFNITEIDRDVVKANIQVLASIDGLQQHVNLVVEATKKTITLEGILGEIFRPLAYVIGVPWSEAQVAGSFIGQKIVANEFVAYQAFMPYLQDGAPIVLSEKTKAIISFALCGFANLSSVAILLGGLGGLAPSRRQDIARMGMKAVAAGTLSNLMSATIAGFFITLAAMTA